MQTAVTDVPLTNQYLKYVLDKKKSCISLYWRDTDEDKDLLFTVETLTYYIIYSVFWSVSFLKYTNSQSSRRFQRNI